MGRTTQRLTEAVKLVREGHGRQMLQSASVRLNSVSPSLGLARDLTVPHAAPPAKIPVEVRPLRAGEELGFLAIDPSVDGHGAVTLLQQQRILDSGIGTCWIAVEPDGSPTYMQFLIFPRDNAGTARLWGDLFPRLRPGECLLEGAYTPEAYRGKGIMAHAMALIADAAAEQGARSAVTFVADDNIASLKGCKKAGFYPYTHRFEIWRAGRRRILHEPMPPGTRYAFDEQAPVPAASRTPTAVKA